MTAAPTPTSSGAHEALIQELENEADSIFRHPDIDGLIRRAAIALRASSPTPQMAGGEKPRFCSCKASARDGQHMAWCPALSPQTQAGETRPFYGAECPSYPACEGGCGLGCTKEIERTRDVAQASPRCDKCGSSGDTYVLCSGCGGPLASPPAALPAGTWQPADSAPPVAAGQMKEFIVAVYRPKAGKVYTFGCMYLNEHRIQYEYCPKKYEPGFCDDCEDGCKTTGWFYLVGDDNNESGCYQPIWLSEGAKLIGWQDLPQWHGTLPSTQSATTNVSADEETQIKARLAYLYKKQEDATSWGAAVGARHEEIKSLEGRLSSMSSAHDAGARK